MSKIIHGDCLTEMEKISPKSIDMILTDLPYNITQNSWDSTEINLQLLWKLFNNVIKPIGVIALTSSQPFTSKLVLSNIEQYKHEWIWEKDGGSNFGNINREPMKEHESVLIFSNGNWTYNPIKEKRIGSRKNKNTKSICNTNSENYGRFNNEPFIMDVPPLRVPRSIQRFTRERGLHPTQKPVLLFEYLIKTYTNERDMILDCCAGSGATAIACINTNREYIVIEKEKKYYDIITKRVRKK